MASSQTQPKLRVIDFTKENMKPGSSSWLESCDNVRNALEEDGCFVAIYDNVSSELSNGVFAAAKDLFDLPMETKVKNTSDKPYFGYLGKMAHIPIHESLGIEHATTLYGVSSFTNTMWPSGNHKFCDTMLQYTKLVAELEQMVDKMVFQSYGLDNKYYDSHLESTTYILRIIKYRAPFVEESSAGADVHTDKGFLTILHQNDVNGLQVQTRKGEWIAVDFPPQSFVVMAGDAYLAWSNDRIHSALHKVILSENKPRYTFALFAYNTGITNVPKELVDERHPLQFKPFDNFGLLYYYPTDMTCINQGTARPYCGIHN